MEEKAAQGALTETVFYILLSLSKPRHGYAIMRNAERLTGGRVSLGPGTLYGALNALLKKQWICEANRENSDTRKKEYALTRIGENALAQEIARLQELVRNAKSELEGMQ